MVMDGGWGEELFPLSFQRLGVHSGASDCEDHVVHREFLPSLEAEINAKES
jgi:hypothetical protein